ncbi:hypothetical protein N7451_006010 [Penicillium sp. IBT 35674x]|nr:hypothetical protein N7451_006010 [Penicillium sp. IBT 35674x]
MWLLRSVACHGVCMTRFLLHINVLGGRPEVVYMLIDAENGTRICIPPEEYSSHSFNKGGARGLFGADCDEVRVEKVAAYYAEK